MPFFRESLRRRTQGNLPFTLILCIYIHILLYYNVLIRISGPKETQEGVESGINGSTSNGCSFRRLFCKVIGLYVHLTSSKTAFPPCTIRDRFFTKGKVFSLGCFIIPFPLPLIIVYALKVWALYRV